MEETYKETVVKEEIDLVDGNYFESTTNYDLDEIQLYVCD